jgi:hypothetical protein
MTGSIWLIKTLFLAPKEAGAGRLIENLPAIKTGG